MNSKIQFRDASPSPSAWAPSFGGEWWLIEPSQQLYWAAEADDCSDDTAEIDAAIDSAFFGSQAGRSCYARAHRSGWVLVVRQVVAQREPPVMLRVWGRVER